MWRVDFESLKVETEVKKLVASKQLTLEDQNIIHAWIRQVSVHGPLSIQGDFKWADHALKGTWSGYRSSSFSNRGRIIYKVVDKKVLISIARITVEHDYRRRGQK